MSKHVNGHANGHATRALSPADEAVEKARAHLQGQERLRAEADAQLERASKTRAAAEAAYARATTARDEAVAKSSAKREDKEALDDETRSEVLVSHAKRDLDAALGQHSACSSTARTAGAAVSAAEREHEKLAVEADILAPSRRERMEAHGAAIVHHLGEVHSHLSALLEELEADHGLVRKARALGSSIAHSDGLAAGVGFARAMLAKGVDLGGAEALVICWVFESPADRPAATLAKMLADAVAILVPSLTRKPNPNGAAVLRHAIESWGPHRSWAEARRSAMAPPPAPAPEGWISTAPSRAPATRVLHDDATQYQGDLDEGDAVDHDRA